MSINFTNISITVRQGIYAESRKLSSRRDNAAIDLFVISERRLEDSFMAPFITKISFILIQRTNKS